MLSKSLQFLQKTVQANAHVRLTTVCLMPQVQVPPTTSSRPTEPLPSTEEAAALLKNQAVYTSHLEAESRYIKVWLLYDILFLYSAVM